MSIVGSFKQSGRLMMIMKMMMVMMNCFCGMVDRRNVVSPISSRNHCRRSSTSQLSDTPQVLISNSLKVDSGTGVSREIYGISIQ